MILLNPGPVNLSDAVTQAMVSQDMCHREVEFSDLQAKVRQALLAVYGLAEQDWAAVMLAGSGTAAVEAMLASLIAADDEILIIENGVYGERMSAIAKVYGLNYKALHFPWGADISLDEVTQLLDQNSGIRYVLLVHHETTTGRLNDLAAIGELCRQRQIHLLVDAVSSFAAEQLDFSAWHIGALTITANKCLHGAPGLSGVIVQKSLLEAATNTGRSYYLDLNRYYQAQSQNSTPFTPPTHLYLALARALVELAQQGGWQSRHQHYQRLADQVRKGLAKLGIQALLPAQPSSVVLTAYKLPEGMLYQTLHDALKLQGFVIYAGQGQLSGGVFRISIMGELHSADINRLLQAFTQILPIT